MNYYILSIGNIKKQPESEIYSNYSKRLKHKLVLKEYVSRLPSGKARKSDESKNLIKMLEGKGKAILLDERGENISSIEFCSL